MYITLMLSHLQTLYGLYVADGCDRNIDCPVHVSSTVSSNLCPAYDDLFDGVEEHALAMLLLPWLELCHTEDSAFQEVCMCALSSLSNKNYYFAREMCIDCDVHIILFCAVEGVEQKGVTDLYR